MKAYLVVRRHYTEYIPAKNIENFPPIVRNDWVKDFRQISAGAIHRFVGRLYAKSGIRQAIDGKNI